MTRPKPAFIPEPRVLNEFQVACRLGWSVSTFGNRLGELYEMGFPRPNDFLGGWDWTAVEDWLDRQFGTAKPAPGENPWDGALENGEGRHAVR